MPRDTTPRDDTATDRDAESTSDRRAVCLAVLRDAAGAVSLPELAKRVAAREAPHTDASVQRIRQTYLSLYHDHVEQLSAAGLVRYREEDGTVELITPEDGIRTAQDWSR